MVKRSGPINFAQSYSDFTPQFFDVTNGAGVPVDVFLFTDR